MRGVAHHTEGHAALGLDGGGGGSHGHVRDRREGARALLPARSANLVEVQDALLAVLVQVVHVRLPVPQPAERQPTGGEQAPGKSPDLRQAPILKSLRGRSCRVAQ
eukprot:479599-Prorocentrum_minimum.AAC.5